MTPSHTSWQQLVRWKAEKR